MSTNHVLDANPHALAVRPKALASSERHVPAHGLLGRNLNRLFVGVTVLADIWLVTAAFVVAYWLYFLSGLIEHSDVPPFSAYYMPIPMVVFIWMIVAPSLDLHRCPKGFSWTKTVVDIAKTAAVGCIITMALSFMYRGFSYSRATFVLGWMLATVLVSLERLLAWEFLAMVRASGRALTNTAIIGLARPARDIVRSMNEHREMGYNLVGFIADRSGEEERLRDEGVPYLGMVDQVKDIVRRCGVELLVIAVPHSERVKILNVVSECDLERVQLRIASGVLDMMTRPLAMDEVAGIPLLGLREHPMTGWQGTVKGLIDLVGSLVGVVVLSPVLAAIALAVKLTSKGPVFYKQVRVGRDDRPFAMIKFRTMRENAEVATGPVFAQANDTRYTPIGGFLRRTSLDELPQLFNVLKGEMSLVGPRPERPNFVGKFKEDIPRYMSRHKIKSGMTGWAQVNGLRGNTSIEERTKYDLHYIENWSLAFDLKIIFMTIMKFFAMENAY